MLDRIRMLFGEQGSAIRIPGQAKILLGTPTGLYSTLSRICI
jgi:hypothetical protein